jgi:multicomponent Na+:H+ antiporter subunit E
MRWILRVAPAFVVFWLVLSGHFTALFLILGALSVALVCWITWRADVIRHDEIPPRLLVRLPWYFLWLGKEVLLASLTVLRAIWSPRTVLVPVVETTPARDLAEVPQVVYANSITLTPGTLSLALGDGHIEVHSLDAAGVATLDEGKMLRQVQRLEERR